MKITTTLNLLQSRWNAFNPREQTLIRRTTIFLGLALLWWVAVAPPIRTLRQAEVQRRSLDVQWETMQNLRAQAQTLQSQPSISHDEALRALDGAVKLRLGTTAQLEVVGERATITLRNTPADALALWLAQARVNARAMPNEAQLLRSQGTPAGSAAWDGTLVLSLPAQ